MTTSFPSTRIILIIYLSCCTSYVYITKLPRRLVSVADPDVTQLLLDLEGGQREAFDRLLVKVYPALRQMAHAKLRGERAGYTLNTTGLVHEA